MNKMFTAMIAVIALLSLTACGGDKMMKKMMTEPASQSSMMK